MIRKWRVFKLTNSSPFAALLIEVPLGSRDAALTKPQLNFCIFNCLRLNCSTKDPYNDNLWLFRALADHLHGNQKLKEETTSRFRFFTNKLSHLFLYCFFKFIHSVFGMKQIGLQFPYWMVFPVVAGISFLDPSA